jgi:MFS family permease
MAGLYAFAVMALSRVIIRHVAPGKRQGSSGLSDLIQGLRYIRRDPTLFVLLLVSTVTSLLALPYQLMLPGFVEQVLGGGPVELGLLIAVSAIGSLLGALALASLPLKRRGLALLGSGLIIGLALVGFSATTSIWLGAAFMLFIGVGSAGRQALGNVLLQTYSLDEYRGRVMSIYMTQFGLMSFGAVLVGIFAEEVGGQWALGSMATALIIVTFAIVIFVPRMRDLE